jgi:hypothetical protein
MQFFVPRKAPKPLIEVGFSLLLHGTSARAGTIMPSTSDTSSTIPITVFTGFLGAGKTSIILSLLPQLPKGYRVVLLKNEFGDIKGRIKLIRIDDPTLINIDAPTVDSQLAKQSSLTAVSEILNGCMSVFLSLPL